MRSSQMIEEKLDGERIQLHKKGGKFRYWSRCVSFSGWSARASVELMLTDRALQENEGLHLHLRQGCHRGRADAVHCQPVPGGRRRVRALLC